MSLLSLLPTAGEFCVLRADIADRLLTCGDGDAALLYLYLLRRGTSFEEDAAMRELKFSRERFDRAVQTLTHFQIVQYPAQAALERRKIQPPRYTAAELGRLRAENHKFETVCQTAEKLLGKRLTLDDLRTLMKCYDYLELPPEVLIDMMYYLYQENSELTMKALASTASQWCDRGIRTADDALAYMKQKQLEKPLLNAMKQTLTHFSYTVSSKEEMFLSLWIEQGFDVSALELAINRMLYANGSFNWKYLKKILANWHEKNIHTAIEIHAAEPRSQSPALSGFKNAPSPSSNHSSDDLEKFFVKPNSNSANDLEKFFPTKQQEV